MDVELSVLMSHLKACRLVLEHRQERLDKTKSKLSLHYARLRHTKIMAGLVAELEGVAHQDPDNWNDEPDSFPF